jgi:hypothetical protein
MQERYVKKWVTLDFLNLVNQKSGFEEKVMLADGPV